MYSKVFVVLAAAAFASANDIHKGHNDTTDLKPVFKEHFSAEWAFTRPTKEVFVNVSGLITGINVTDLRDGKDGVATIVSGGIGHDNVTISLQSPVLRGYDFMVEVYADEKEIERGGRGLPEMPVEHPIATEKTTRPESVSTSTVKPTEVHNVPTETELPTSKPEVAGISTTHKPVTAPDVTGHPTTPTGKPMPKLDMEIPDEADVPMKVADVQPPSTEKHI